jgi:6-phosphofructo-2-kinase/fructose-2,6-biphosphatase 2
VAVIAHQAVLRALYAYFTGTEPERCPYLSVPLHTVLKLTPHAYGCHEERFPLAPQSANDHSHVQSQPPSQPPAEPHRG